MFNEKQKELLIKYLKEKKESLDYGLDWVHFKPGIEKVINEMRDIEDIIKLIEVNNNGNA